jgi:tight adherence protein C
LALPLLVFSLVGGQGANGRVSRNLSAGLVPGNDLRRLVLGQSAAERLARPVVAALAGRARRMTPSGRLAHLERRLNVAGATWPIEYVLAAKLAAAGFLGGAGAVWTALSPSLPRAVVAVVAGAAGWFAPEAVLYGRGRERQLTVRHELPDILDQITVCVEAGLGFDSALARASKTHGGPLAQEIQRMLQDVRVGIPRMEALESMLARTDVAELRQLVHAVHQAETYGVPVAQALRAQAGEQREKRRQRAEEQAMKIPVKLVFPLVLCILPTLFIVVLGPAVLRFTRAL